METRNQVPRLHKKSKDSAEKRYKVYLQHAGSYSLIFEDIPYGCASYLERLIKDVLSKHQAKLVGKFIIK